MRGTPEGRPPLKVRGDGRVPTMNQVLPEGVYHWTATHPEWEGPVSAYAIDDGARLILIDPIAVPDEVPALSWIARGGHGPHLHVARA